MSQSDPFQELVDNLRQVLIPAPPPTLPTTSASTIATSLPMIASAMARQAPFSGVVEEFQTAFFYNVRLPLKCNPISTPQKKIVFFISLLSGKALQWAETIWAQAGNVTQSFANFIAHFSGVFGCPSGDSSVSDQLYHLQQCSLPIKVYALRFRNLAAASGWNERSLVTSYRQGLEPRLHLQLAGYDDTCALENLIKLFPLFHTHAVLL